ncbi:MAG TPA: amidohydrolase family protein, partial [Ktedonobacterales bacterium]|nr:amidohydrolase family protein [Ktedonobacterales bacterium]
MEQQGTYDLVLLNGRVMDPETNRDMTASVGIRDGKIAAVEPERLTGKEVVDAAGLVIAPGFIDLHMHGQTTPSMRMQAFDGVTTALELEAGNLPIDLAYEVVAREGRPLNYGFSASWALARMSLLDNVQLDGSYGVALANLGGPQWGKLTPPEQSQHILALVEQGVQEGALGIGILLGYGPQTNREEYYALAQLAARYHVPTFTHVRWGNFREPGSSYEGIAEVVAAAAATGAHMHVCHVNSTSLRHMDQVLDVIGSAQRQGLNITTEMYPYGAGCTVLGAHFAAPEALPQLGIEATAIFHVGTGRWIGSADELAQLRAHHPADLGVFHFLDENKPEERVLLEHALAFPNTAIATDALPFSVDGTPLEGDAWPLPENALGHPRASGTYARVLGKYVREQGIISLMEALRRAALVPAQILEEAVPQMKYKGRLQV